MEINIFRAKKHPSVSKGLYSTEATGTNHLDNHKDLYPEEIKKVSENDNDNFETDHKSDFIGVPNDIKDSTTNSHAAKKPRHTRFSMRWTRTPQRLMCVKLLRRKTKI